MNANTATISRAYAEGVIQSYNSGLRGKGIRVQTFSGMDLARRGQVQLQPAFLYNPGLVDSWFIVTGVFGLLLILNSSLVSSAAMVREREAGTIEQLLMSPASTSEIINCSIVPASLSRTMAADETSELFRIKSKPNTPVTINHESTRPGL